MVCSKCGAQNPDDANFCIGCGAKFISRSENISSASYSGFGSFWERFLAYLIDSAILTLGSVVIVFFGAFFIGFILALIGMEVEKMENFFVGVYYILAFVLCWFYFTIMESSKLQATLGKKICYLVVTDTSGNRITFAKANSRFWSKFISGAIFCIGYIMAAFTEKHQALHDIIAGTIVVKKN
ncbi:RDD family protein [candidate division WOR-3 bacterium]|nr:RDD family protein [candidate division WOR-3 bacterium]